jgi:hypothetical protein
MGCASEAAGELSIVPNVARARPNPPAAWRKKTAGAVHPRGQAGGRKLQLFHFATLFAPVKEKLAVAATRPAATREKRQAAQGSALK